MQFLEWAENVENVCENKTGMQQNNVIHAFIKSFNGNI